MTAWLLLCAASGGHAIQAPPRDQQPPDPLPLEVVTALHGHSGRSPVTFSPDGEWLAHTVETDEIVARGTSRVYTDTGVSLFEGDARTEAILSSTSGDRQILLGGAGSSSWAPVWSPRGDRVAFFSDADGEAGLWIWDRSTATARRLGDLIVRPAFGFEVPRWSADGERVLVEVLPPGVSLAEANAHFPHEETRRGGSVRQTDELTVSVRRSAQAEAGAGRDTVPSPAVAPPGDVTATYIADLVVVDATTGAVERIVERTRIGWYAFSPDGRYVAYTAMAGIDPLRQQSLSDLRVVDLAAATDRLVAGGVPFFYNSEWSWSPDGRRLAYMRSGVSADGGITILSVEDSSRIVTSSRAGFDPGTGEYRPVWSMDGTALYGVMDGALWQIDAETGATEELARLKDWHIRNVVATSYLSPVAWSPDSGRTIRVTARETGGGAHAGFVAIETATGRARIEQRQYRTHGFGFSLAASDATGKIVFAASDQHTPAELWLFDPGTGATTQASRINAALTDYALGNTRLIHWQSMDGEDRAGALLLPPGYEQGTPLPLVVWVYGGLHGSAAANRFGLWSSNAAFNLQVLATRGYAVLWPDAPVRTGQVTNDLVASVLPGVDAAIEQGYADAERLAIMGQSYGSLNVLAILTRTNRFRAAVITAAVLHPDLVADYLANPGYYEAGQGNMGCTIWECPERYHENSPIFDFPRIETPLLIAMGSLDGNLVPAQAICTALDRLGRHVEYRVYDGEDHVISGRANVIDLWTRRLEFLADHLTGSPRSGRTESSRPRRLQ